MIKTRGIAKDIESFACGSGFCFSIALLRFLTKEPFSERRKATFHTHTGNTTINIFFHVGEAVKLECRTSSQGQALKQIH